MRQQHLLLSFLPGFAPILVYIAAEALWGETAGLVAGMALGIGEFLFILIKDRRVDAFTLVDTLLLAAMGALSWALSDPIFFRLKPAVSGGILSLMIIAGALGPHRLFLPYLQNKMGMGELPEAAVRRMIGMLAGFGFLTLVHSGLTAVAALWWSKAAWDFVAGALFWILALLYMALWTVSVLLKRVFWARALRTGEGAGEMLPVVDGEGRIIGKAPRPLCHAGTMGEKPLHPVIRLWLTDGKGGWWLQKRSDSKLVQPGKWDAAVGGHVGYGETIETALAREAREEIGLADLAGVKPSARFVWETELERELVFLFILEVHNPVFTADPSEVSGIRLWTRSEIQAEIASIRSSEPNKKAASLVLTGLAAHELASGLIKPSGL